MLWEARKQADDYQRSETHVYTYSARKMPLYAQREAYAPVGGTIRAKTARIESREGVLVWIGLFGDLMERGKSFSKRNYISIWNLCLHSSSPIFAMTQL